MKEGYKKTALGALPEDWTVVHLEDVSNKITDGSHFSPAPVAQSNFLIATVKDMRKKSIGTSTCARISEKDFNLLSANGCKPTRGDILFSKDGTIGKTFVFEGESNIVLLSSIAIIKLNKELALPQFIAQVLQSTLFANQLEGLKSGSAIRRLVLKAIKEIKVPIASLDEQEKITEILSTVDEKIDVIDEQIAATAELKQGLMQRLLTKGIGHSKFKLSPLGEIPETWEVCKFGELVQSYSYGPRFSSNDYSELGNVKTIRGTDVSSNGDILYHQVPTARLDDEVVKNHKLEDGDLVMITTADCGMTGVFYLQDTPYIASAYAVRLRLNRAAHPEYFKHLMQTPLAKNQVQRFIRKGTVANLPGSDILKFDFAVPPIIEQQRIATLLNTVEKKLQVLEEKKAVYQELKQGLTQQLLTGKIRVATQYELKIA